MGFSFRSGFIFPKLSRPRGSRIDCGESLIRHFVLNTLVFRDAAPPHDDSSTRVIKQLEGNTRGNGSGFADYIFLAEAFISCKKKTEQNMEVDQVRNHVLANKSGNIESILIGTTYQPVMKRCDSIQHQSFNGGHTSLIQILI